MVLACYGSAAGLRAYEPLVEDVRAAVPGVPVRLALVSGPVRRTLEARGEEAPSLPEALEDLAAQGARRVVVQPVLVSGGRTLDAVCQAADAAREAPDGPEVVVAPELLAGPEDARRLAAILSRDIPAHPAGAVLLGAHGGEGWEAPAALLSAAIAAQGRPDVLLATLHDDPDVAVARLRAAAPGARHVTLASLMLAEGAHARWQLWGSGLGAPSSAAHASANRSAAHPSWRDRLSLGGYDVSMRTAGLLHLDGVRRMFVEHATGALAAPGE